MPNTLAHIAVQGLFTRAMIRTAPLPWIYLGCVVPDLPWIFRRIVLVVWPSLAQLPLFDLFFHMLTALGFCALFSLTVAMLVKDRRQVFAILTLGSLLHLLLDACQDKWGNGVLLFAPFDWRLTSFGFFEMESLPSVLLTASGFIYFLWFCRPGKSSLTIPWVLSRRRLSGAAVLLVVYFLSPLVMFSGPLRADTAYCQTYLDVENRSGKPLAIDRVDYVIDQEGDYLLFPSGEKLFLDTSLLTHNGIISVKGTFVASDRLRVAQFKLHPEKGRDLASYAGLLLIAAYWGFILLRRREDQTVKSMGGMN